jgi:hypothetical protein
LLVELDPELGLVLRFVESAIGIDQGFAGNEFVIRIAQCSPVFSKV